MQCSDGLEIVGPHIISLKGGMGGTYVKTRGKLGVETLTVNDIKTEFEIK